LRLDGVAILINGESCFARLRPRVSVSVVRELVAECIERQDVAAVELEPTLKLAPLARGRGQGAADH